MVRTADPQTLRLALKEMVRERSLLAGMQVLYTRLGGMFQIPLPGFRGYVVGGPLANRRVLVTEREKLSWRSSSDPVSVLLRQGILVTDGPEHDHDRKLMEPALSPVRLPGYLPAMLANTDRVTAAWADGQVVDMLAACRRIALLIVMKTLFSVDVWEDLPRLWRPVLRAVEFISPGAWLVFPWLPRVGFQKPLRVLDDYLYGLIRERRAAEPCNDLLGHLMAAGLDDDRIRDQMLTMIIAGHDTSTSLLAWAFYLLGTHPEVMHSLQAEVRFALQGQRPHSLAGWQPPLLDAVIKETLRLYPPAHMGSRRLAQPMAFDGLLVPAGERLIYSIYLTHRDPDIWAMPQEFQPERFSRGRSHPPFAFVPFGGGPRSCPGAAFGQAEARIVIGRLLQTHDFQLVRSKVHVHMGAALEPRPGVWMRVRKGPA